MSVAEGVIDALQRTQTPCLALCLGFFRDLLPYFKLLSNTQILHLKFELGFYFQRNQLKGTSFSSASQTFFPS